MFTQDTSGQRSLTSMYITFSAPLATFASALDLLFVFVMTFLLLLIVSILWRKKKSPRQQFILDLLNAESVGDHCVEVLPVHKDHSLRRAA